MTECLRRITQLFARSSNLLREHVKMVSKAQNILKDGHGLYKVLALVRASLSAHVVSVVSSCIAGKALTLVKASTSQKVHIENAPSRPPTPVVKISKLSADNRTQLGRPSLRSYAHKLLFLTHRRRS